MTTARHDFPVAEWLYSSMQLMYGDSTPVGDRNIYFLHDRAKGLSSEIEPALKFLSNFFYWLFILHELKLKKTKNKTKQNKTKQNKKRGVPILV